MSVFSERLRQIGRNTVVPEGDRSNVPSVAPRDMTQGDPNRPGSWNDRRNEEMERDRLTLGSAAFTAKYGTTANTARLLPDADTFADPVERRLGQLHQRSLDEVTADSLRSLGGGAATGVGGLLNLGVRVVDGQLQTPTSKAVIDKEGNPSLELSRENPLFNKEEVMANIAGGARDVRNWLVGFNTNEIDRKQRIAQVSKAPAMKDNAIRYEQSDKTFLDGVRKIGRDALVEADNLRSNGAVAGNTVAEATGSLAPSLIGSGGASAVARSVLGKTGLREGAKKGIERGVTAGSIGAMEGQGAYDSTMLDVLDMSDAELRKSSDLYSQLRAGGLSEREAKLQVGDKAGGRAQLIQTGVATVAGYFVSKFEGAPLSKEVRQNNIRTLLSQTAEEAFQSGSGQVSSNLGIQEYADTDRSITEGVGESITQGALGGLGATGVILTPGATVNLASQGKEKITQGIQKAAAYGAERARKKIDDTNPVGEKATTTAIDDIDNLVAGVEQLKTVQSNAAPEDIAEVIDPSLASDVETISSLGLNDTTSPEYVEATAPIAEDVVEGSRLKTLRKVSAKLRSGAYKSADQVEAASNFVIQQMEGLQSFIENVRTRKEEAPETVGKIESAAAEMVTNVIANKTFAESLGSAEGVLNTRQASDTSSPITPREVISNPIGSPQAKLKDATGEGFTPIETKALKVAQAISPPDSGSELPAPAGKTAAAGPNKKNTRAETRKELVFAGAQSQYGDLPSFNDLVSLTIKGAVKANRTGGNTVVAGPGGGQVDAKDSFARLGNLVKHQLNKHAAAQASLQKSAVNPGKDSSIQYETLDPRTGDSFIPADKGNSIYVNAGSANSLETLRAVAEDTNTGIRAYNELLKQFPDVYTGSPYAEVDVPSAPVQATEGTTENETSTENATVEERTGQNTEQPAGENTQEEAPGVRDASVDDRPSGVPSGDTSSTTRPVGELDFAALFEGGSQTTFAKMVLALDVEGLGREDQAVLDIIKNSTFFKNNPDIVVREGRPEEARVAEDGKGWWDPAAQEIVLFTPKASVMLHEGLHAVTLEALNQNIFTTYDGLGRDLTPQEKAAKALLEMANEFIEKGPNNQRANRVRQLMINLINGDVEAQGARGIVLAVNEFMAYGLTDKQVRKDLAKSLPQFQEPKLGQKIMRFVRRILGVPDNNNVLSRVFFNTGILSRDPRDFAKAPVKTEAQTEKVEAVEEPSPAPSTEDISSVEAPATETVQPSAAGAAQSVQVSAPEVSPSLDASVAEPEIKVGSNLAQGSDGQPTVLKAHSLDPVMSYDDGLIDLIEANENLDYIVDDGLKAQLINLDQEIEGMIEGMNTKLREDGSARKWGKTGKSYLDILKENQESNFETADIQSVVSGRTLSLLDRDSVLDDSPEYDQHLLKLALYAAVDYVMNTPNGGGLYKTSDILKALNLPEGTQVTPEMREIMNFGRSATDVKEGMAKQIRAFWGTKLNANTSASVSLGLSEAMADEIMHYFDTIGSETDFWMRKSAFKLEGDVKSYTAFKLGTQGEDLGSGITALRDILAPNREDAHQYRLGKPFSELEVSDTLKKDNTLLISEPKRKAIAAQQATTFRLSKGFTEFMDVLGQNALEDILGFQEVDDTKFYNVNDRAAIEGKNISIRTSVTEVTRQRKRIEDYAEKNGVAPSDVPVHYKLEISANGRFFMQGFNPQANKLAREVISSTQSTIDFSSSSDMQALFAAVGQSFDQGDLKVENLGLARSAEYAQELLQGRYRPAVDAIKNADRLGSNLGPTLKEALADPEIENSARLLKGLYAVAQLELAQEAGQTSFETDLPMELDGKTNGPISAAIQNNTEEFSPEMLALYRRGGFFIGGTLAPENYADYQTGEDTADLYEVTGDLQSTKLVRLMKGILDGRSVENPSHSQPAYETQKAVLDLLAEMGDIKFTRSRTEINSEGIEVRIPGELTVKRRGTKSPITQSLYGAGNASISAGLTNAIFKTVYEEISDAVRAGNGDRVKKLALLIDKVADVDVQENRKSGKIEAIVDPVGSSGSLVSVISNKSSAKIWRESLETFSFDPRRFERLQNAIGNLYTSAFEDALSDTVGHSTGILNKSLVSATNTHTDIYTQLVTQAIGEMTLLQRKPLEQRTPEELERSKTKIGAGDELSAADRNRIIAEHRKYAPVIDTGFTTFTLSGSDQETSSQVAARRAKQRASDKKNGTKTTEPTFNARSETLSGSSSASKRDAFKGAGVRSLPNTVISNADVSMMTDVFNDPDMPNQVLAVHDGIEASLRDIIAVSLAMNKAVAKSWQTNTLVPILKSLESVLELESEMRARGISEDQLTELKASAIELSQYADRRQAKIDALETVQFRVDGAPGAEAPFVKDTGAVFESEQDLVDHLNREYHNNLRKAKPLPDGVEIESATGSELRKDLEGSGFGGDINLFVQAVAKHIQNKDQKLVFDAITRSPAFQEVVEAGLSVVVEPTGQGGSFDATSRTINISNLTTETALHELVHAATVYQIEAHYLGLDNNENVDRTRAVKRLESLRNDFMLRTFEEGSTEAQLKALMQGLIDNDPDGTSGGQIEALHEFLAWSLSNKDLISRGKETVATDALSQVKAFGRQALQAMRRLLGFASNKVFDHIYFNTSVIVNTPSSSNSDLNGSMKRSRLRHQVNNDGSQVKSMLQAKIDRRVAAFLAGRDRAKSTAVEGLRRKSEAEVKSLDAINRMSMAGFRFDNPQDLLLFKSLYSVLSMELDTDKGSLLEAQKIFEALSSELSSELFLEAFGTSGPKASQGQSQKAERMYRALTGLPFEDVQTNSVVSPDTTETGLSDKLAVFIALAQTDPVVRQVLDGINISDLNINKEFDSSSVDSLITSLADKLFGSINSKILSKEDRSVTEAMDTLADLLLTYDEEAATDIENKASDAFRNLNDRLATGISDAGRVTGDKLKSLSERIADPADASQTGAVRKLASATVGVIGGLADALNEERGQAKVERLTSFLNNDGVPNAIRELWSEIRGSTQSTEGVFSLVKKAKQQISAVRQEYIEQLPKILAKQFSEQFTEKQEGETNRQAAQRLEQDWAHMFLGLGKAEVTSIMSSLGEPFVLSMFGASTQQQQRRRQAVVQLKGKMAQQMRALGLTDSQSKRILDAYALKAKQLGNYQITGEVGVNLLTSAYAITGLFNEDGGVISKEDHAALQKALSKFRRDNTSADFSAPVQMRELIGSIDALASLEAVDALPFDTQSRMAELMRDEIDGVRFALSYMADLHKQENNKTDSVMGKVNGYKGFLNTKSRRKHSVVIESDINYTYMVERGYTRIRAYDGLEGGAGASKAYYFSAHQKLANYNQGALQTVQDTYRGVDPQTGLTVGVATTSEMIDGDEAKVINRRIKNNPAMAQNTQDQLIPVFTEYGGLIGYERAVAPDMMSMLESSNNFAEALAGWSGRIKEEQAAEGFNQGLVDALYENYEADRIAGREDEYAAFGRVVQDDGSLDFTDDLKNDKIWKESYLLMPRQAREYGHELFGGPIMIRKDMINNAVGFRSGSVGDIFTGQTRMNEEMRQTVKDIMLATPFIGPDMYKILTQAEDVAQQIVSEVKHVIVVKSGVILAANTLSNVVQLAGREVPLSFMGKRTKIKYAEVARYKDNEELKIQLRAKMVGARSSGEVEALQNQINKIEESEKRMSIWPLIEASQFTTISEGLTDVDKALMDGKYMDWIEKKAGELPGGLSTVARYAIVAKDTALYKGMSRAVQYSDFIAKAVYYDFLTEERGVSKEDALATVDSEFINYDLADGRTRTYLESMGLTWFMNFKIRAIKIAINMAKRNPASVLMTLGIAGAIGLNVGSPVGDNLATAGAEGRLSYSVGPGMVEAGWNLNLWKQIFG